MAASPLPSRGPRGEQKCYVPPPFSGVPDTKHGVKIRSRCLGPHSSEIKKSAELLHTPTFSGVPHAKRGHNSRTAYLTPAL